MKNALVRWGLIAAATLAVGPLLDSLMAVARDGSGGRNVTLLVSQAPAVSLALGLIVIAAAAAFGYAVRRVTTIGLGLFCAGAIVAWPAFNGATAEGLVRDAQSAGPFARLAVEMALLGVIGVLGTRFIVGRIEPDPSGREDPEELIGPRAALGAGVSFVVAGVSLWILAREGTPGQNTAAAGLAAMAAVAAGRSAAPKASIVACVAGIFAVGLAGPILALVTQGSDIVVAAYSNSLAPLARITPMTWLAGVWLGAPIGASWASSMVEHKEQAAPARA